MPRLKKGSDEAKEYMAKIREKKTTNSSIEYETNKGNKKNKNITINMDKETDYDENGNSVVKTTTKRNIDDKNKKPNIKTVIIKKPEIKEPEPIKEEPKKEEPIKEEIKEPEPKKEEPVKEKSKKGRPKKHLTAEDKLEADREAKREWARRHRAKLKEEKEKAKEGKGLKKARVIKTYGKLLNHLVSHIEDVKEPVDKKDYQQSKEIIDEIKHIKGGSLNYIVQSIVFDKDKFNIKDARKWLKENGFKSPKVDIETNTIRFRQIAPSKVKKEGYEEYRNKPLGNSGINLILVYKKLSHSNNITMPKFSKGSEEAREHMARIRSLKGKKANRREEVESSSDDDASMEGGRIHPEVVVKNAIEEARKILGVGLEPPSRLYGSHTQPLIGGGVHYHIYGGDILGDMRRAFDPKQNGVARAFQPVQKAFDPNQNGVAKAFSPGGSAEQFGKKVASTLIHQGIPVVTGALGAMGAEVLAPELGPVSGMAGNYAGKKAGEQLANVIGQKTGYGFKKGSKEAKEHMAKIRAMKRKN